MRYKSSKFYLDLQDSLGQTNLNKSLFNDVTHSFERNIDITIYLMNNKLRDYRVVGKTKPY